MQYLRDNAGVLEASANGTDWEVVALGEGGGGTPATVADPVAIGTNGRIRFTAGGQIEFSNDGGVSWFPPMYASSRPGTIAETTNLGDGVVQISGAGYLFKISKDGGATFKAPLLQGEDLNCEMEFYPPLVESATEPEQGGMYVWHDTTSGNEKFYLVYQDALSVNHKLELV